MDMIIWNIKIVPPLLQAVWSVVHWCVWHRVHHSHFCPRCWHFISLLSQCQRMAWRARRCSTIFGCRTSRSWVKPSWSVRRTRARTGSVSISSPSCSIPCTRYRDPSSHFGITCYQQMLIDHLQSAAFLILKQWFTVCEWCHLFKAFTGSRKCTFQ